jgi:hypothetical protein
VAAFNTLFGVLLLGIFSTPYFADEPFTNQWGPFAGTVTDYETGEPIPGAIFVVVWLRNTFPFGTQRYE